MIICRVINCLRDYVSVINCRVICRVIKCHQTARHTRCTYKRRVRWWSTYFDDDRRPHTESSDDAANASIHVHLIHTLNTRVRKIIPRRQLYFVMVRFCKKISTLCIFFVCEKFTHWTVEQV